MKKAIDILTVHNVKPSLQRIAIMNYLLEHHTHPTADEIFMALSPTIPTLSKTTVYNNLKLLAEQGAVLKVSIDEQHTCYDIDTTPHAHFLCKHCNKVYDLPVHDNLQVLADSCGHHIEERFYFYKGICKDCLDKGLVSLKETN